MDIAIYDPNLKSKFDNVNQNILMQQYLWFWLDDIIKNIMSIMIFFVQAPI